MIGVIKSDIGKVRLNNEDAFYLPQQGEFPQLFIVADGMGGHQGGEIASKMAVKEVSSYINSHLAKDCDNRKVKRIMESSIANANNKILSISLENDELLGMGTTITMALLYNGRLYIGHVGDSRAYRIREDHIEQLTKDHSLVWQLVEQGRLTMEETKTHPMKNVITKALGTDEFIEPDIHEFDFKNNDIIVLCSDGLTNMLDNNCIKNIVCSLEPEQAAQKLIEKANLQGGEDNITVGIIKVGKVGM
ncbi:MAG TPA: Stp1/IreP family PP2C-type Ser/Thr phosphatase [Thermoanaerobacterales bacterium]|jgi:serine/threonine protein phosphatase PrpC|nr:Stp1/IreP family PP2C-type Ser/Thr phosphatase [Thermoanaerobacterales bacterium]